MTGQGGCLNNSAKLIFRIENSVMDDVCCSPCRYIIFYRLPNMSDDLHDILCLHMACCYPQLSHCISTRQTISSDPCIIFTAYSTGIYILTELRSALNWLSCPLDMRLSNMTCECKRGLLCLRGVCAFSMTHFC